MFYFQTLKRVERSQGLGKQKKSYGMLGREAILTLTIKKGLKGAKIPELEKNLRSSNCRLK